MLVERLGLPVTSDARPVFVGSELDADTLLPTPGVSLESIPGKIMSFLLHVTTARGWSVAECEWRWPKAFNKLLHPRIGEEAYRSHEQWWTRCVDSEGLAHEFPGLFRLRQEICWQDWPLVQYFFRLLAYYRFQPHSDLERQLLKLSDKVGDTRPIEDGRSFKHMY